MKTDVYEHETKAGAARPQGGNKPGASAADPDEMLKKLQAAGTPGAGHKALDALAGNWKAEVKCWMEPDGPPTVSQATSKANWIFGGRFLEEEFHGEMMGRPFTGRCLMGFDNTKQTFCSVWIDDMNTAMFMSEGTGDKGNKIIMLEGTASCAATGQQDVPMKQIVRVVGPDKHILEMFNDGEKAMEITYTRT